MGWDGMGYHWFKSDPYLTQINFIFSREACLPRMCPACFFLPAIPCNNRLLKGRARKGRTAPLTIIPKSMFWHFLEIHFPGKWANEPFHCVFINTTLAVIELPSSLRCAGKDGALCSLTQWLQQVLCWWGNIIKSVKELAAEGLGTYELVSNLFSVWDVLIENTATKKWKNTCRLSQ